MAFKRRLRRFHMRQQPATSVAEDDGDRMSPGRIRHLLENDPSFQVLSIDGLNWICPFTGTFVSAPFDFRETAAQWLWEHKPWRQQPRPMKTEKLHQICWRRHLRELLPNEARMRHFLPGGKWLNPYTGALVDDVHLAKGKIRREALDQIAKAMAQCPEAQEGRMLDAAELDIIARRERQKAKPSSKRGQPRESEGDDEPLESEGSPPEGQLSQDERNNADHSATSLVVGYRILSRIGQGGMGAVYRAMQLSMQREVALKVLQPHPGRDDAWAERFLLEARSAGGISHPHVVTVYDVGRASGKLYMSMEYMPGGDAATLVDEQGGRIKELDALRIVRDAAAGLEAIHAATIVHRDIKPSNLFLGTDGHRKIGDPGLAKQLADERHLTISGSSLGTPAYMAPEQASGEDLSDHRSDIYALGATFYHLLCGAPPFTGGNVFTIIRQICTDDAIDIRKRNKAVRPETAELIARCLSKAADDRFQTATDLRVALEAALDGCPDIPPAEPDSNAETVTVRRRLDESAQQTVEADLNAQASQALDAKGSPEELLQSAGYELGMHHASIDGSDRQVLRRWGEHGLLLLQVSIAADDEDRRKALLNELSATLEAMDAATHDKPSAILTALADVFDRDDDARCAALAALIDCHEGAVTLCGAGMPAPLVMHPKGPKLEALGLGQPGLESGPAEQRHDQPLALEPGATLLIASPGVHQATDEAQRLYGPLHLAAAALLRSDLPANAQTESLGEDLDQYCEGMLDTDASIVTVKRR